MSQFNPAYRQFSEKLVARIVHSGNPEYRIASADWANALLTLTAPHGLTIGTKYNVCVLPDYVGVDNPMRDILSIPYEYIKQTGGSTVLSFVPTTTTVVKVTKDDGTTIIPVVLTSTENNNNVDISKFHFEIPIGFAVDNLPPMKKARIKMFGFIKNNAQYRYTSIRVLLSDGAYAGYSGSPNDPSMGLSYVGVLGIPTIPNSTATNGIFGMQEWISDFSMHGQHITDLNSQFFARRNGFNTAVFDNANEVQRRNNALTGIGSRTVVGIVGVRTLNSTYAYLANGTVVEVYDMGVS